MNRFPENYFNIGPKIILPGISEELKLPRNTWFRYDGEVKSLVENLAKTDLIIRGQIQESRNLLDKLFDKILVLSKKSELSEKIQNSNELIGYCQPHQIDKDITAYVIAKKKGLDQVKSVFADGHESGELLDDIGRKDILQIALDREGIKLDVSGFNGEDFADIGGLLALYKKQKELGRVISLPQFKYREQILSVLAEPFGFRAI